ncbi:MAG TPA: hypothetical protein VGO56_20720 [Pyrinomonadaceae bacterium]|jgi:hypothetical protein|nr:hypothetical protein [Pyrinomonadaceae bacterium]
MNKINWPRLIIGGLIAAVILFVTDGFFHERVVAADWKAVYDGLGSMPPPQHSAFGLVYFAIFELGRGLISIYLYSLMRSCCGPGPKTAALAGLVAWIAFSLTGPAQFIPLGFFSHALWIKVGAFQLITSIVAAIAGAFLYRDVANS